MKYIFFCLAALLFTWSAVRFFTKGTPGNQKDVKSTTIRLSKSLIDVGERRQNSDVNASYVIYNTGSNDLYIQSVQPDCHCTVADFSKTPIGPNDSTTIILRYDAVQPGAFQSSAVVTSNAVMSNTLLIFRGSIVQ
jgi:hypothetical protein